MAGLTWHWVILSYTYSIGSSAVKILIPGRYALIKDPYKVVLFPEPVGPVTSKMPEFRLRRPFKEPLILGEKPSSSMDFGAFPESRILLSVCISKNVGIGPIIET